MIYFAFLRGGWGQAAICRTFMWRIWSYFKELVINRISIYEFEKYAVCDGAVHEYAIIGAQ